MIGDWGTDHWYQCDGFFTGAKPPWYEAAMGMGADVGAGAGSDSGAVGPVGGASPSLSPPQLGGLGACPEQCSQGDCAESAAEDACDFYCCTSGQIQGCVPAAGDCTGAGAAVDCTGCTAAAKANVNASARAAVGERERAASPTSRGPVDPSKVVADPNWLPVWKGAWMGMAKTDPQAKWLYQGWAIRGWRDAQGASRLKALYDSVPHGQWVPLDMDIDGIWKYWGNYSFFGAPFIWTTIHNMGGNDGLKGDMRLLQDFPG